MYSRLWKIPGALFLGAASGASAYHILNRNNFFQSTDDSKKNIFQKISQGSPVPVPRFPSFTDEVPRNNQGSIFNLSQNYPSKKPKKENHLWEQIDFKTQPLLYLQKLKDYVLEGNVEANWEAEKNKIRPWFHVPWLHKTPAGREFLHGLTRERNLLPGALNPNQKRCVQNWAVGLYNEAGGYTIGEVWKDANNPDPTKGQFPEGTVVVKIIFTEATPEEAPEMEGAFEWRANIHSTIDSMSPKTIMTVRLMQMDVAVKDASANDTIGWVFATFIYDKNAAGITAWDKLVPVGMMWGNDPGITPDDIQAGKSLKETFINTNIPLYGSRSLGWGGRLNGPVDDYVSACASCHSTAQWKPIKKMAPSNQATYEERLKWFRNLKSEAFEEGEISLDYSLQLALSLKNFHAEKEKSARFTGGCEVTSLPQSTAATKPNEKLHPVI
jgi:hypothetical protein